MCLEQNNLKVIPALKEQSNDFFSKEELKPLDLNSARNPSKISQAGKKIDIL